MDLGMTSDSRESDEIFDSGLDAFYIACPYPFRLGVAISVSGGFSALDAARNDCSASVPNPCPSLDSEDL